MKSDTINSIGGVAQVHARIVIRIMVGLREQTTEHPDPAIGGGHNTKVHAMVIFFTILLILIGVTHFLLICRTFIKVKEPEKQTKMIATKSNKKVSSKINDAANAGPSSSK